MATSENSSQDRQAFGNLKKLFGMALAAIAVSVLVSHFLFQRYLVHQAHDSSIINAAGKQRMLSQQLAKEALSLHQASTRQDYQHIDSAMKETLSTWISAHERLHRLAGIDSSALIDTDTFERLLAEINPYFTTIHDAAVGILGEIENKDSVDQANIAPYLRIIRENESHFLRGMDEMVNHLEQAAFQKVDRLKKIEIFLIVFIFLILLLEMIFVFLPAANHISHVVGQLVEEEKKSKRMAMNADQLSREKDHTVKELKVLNQAINQNLFYARIRPDGEIVQLGEHFTRVFDVRSDPGKNKIQHILSTDANDQNQIELLLQQNARSNWQGEVQGTTRNGKEVWMEMSMSPYRIGEDNWEILVIAIDITSRKEAQLEIERLSKEKFESQMNRQKYISGKIIENQEQEQNRIAKDIHDGIGQMLTALSLNLENIDPRNIAKTEARIADLKELTQKIIQGVRTATFNLMPPELSDHGILPALQKLTNELTKLTGQTIFLYDKSNFNLRLDSLVEINLYRIIQEAINNSIKYADSSQIVVTISHSDTLLSINVDDNGKGFDMNEMKSNGQGSDGMGLAYMRERIKYIGGRLFINSSPGKGTRITINIPIDS